MPNPNRQLDKSHLSIDQAEERGFIHRDYIAHCFRWSHVVKRLMQKHAYKDAHILDIGCGRDQPLPRLLYANRMTGFDYSGMDINTLQPHEALVTAHTNGKMRVALHSETDASLLDPTKLKWGLGTHLTCFEVLEHMQPYIANRMILNWKRLLEPWATAWVSTPVFNGSAAANHINEMHWQTLGSAFEHLGFAVVNWFGTFASQSDLVSVISKEDHALQQVLGDYYDSNVLSNIFAPKYPQASRNILWELRNVSPGSDFTRKFPREFEVIPGRNQNPDVMELFTGRE